MSERVTYFVSVILPIPIHKEFTYRVPFEMNDQLLIGIRVIVPFGKSKMLTGIITAISQTPPTEYQAKYIELVLDDVPIITKEQYLFWQWVSTYYMAPIGDVMNAALPSNLKLASETTIVIHPDFDEQRTSLEEREQQIIDVLEIRTSIELKEIAENLSGTKYNSCLLNLYHNGNEGMAYHSDDEKALGKNTSIASMSFGAERKFLFQLMEILYGLCSWK